MDNLCHTLAGVALGETGLKRRSALAIPTLVIGANLPDVDVLAYAWGPVEALGFRRGWTHGVLAMAIWPLVLAGAMYAFGRLRHRTRAPVTGPSVTGPSVRRSPVTRTPSCTSRSCSTPRTPLPC